MMVTVMVILRPRMEIQECPCELEAGGSLFDSSGVW